MYCNNFLLKSSPRFTPPDVKKDDDILVLRLGDTDVYYWLDLNVANVKRLECIVWAINADPGNKIKQDLSNAYWFMMSSMDKVIQIHTSTSNGEPFAWDIQLDTKESRLVVQDSKGNTVYIDSKEDDIGAENSMGSKFQIIKQKIFGTAEEEIRFKTKAFIVECQTALLDAATSVTHKTPKTKSTGDLDVDKNFSYGGTGEGKGTFTVTEAIVNGITFTLHVHKANGEYADTNKPH